jgi:hypothetical protein
MEKVVIIFKAHSVDALTRWRDAQRMVTESAEWKEDTELRKLPQLDVLLAFEDFSRIKTNEYEAAVRKAEVEKAKRVRLGREGFRVSRLTSIVHPIVDLLPGTARRAERIRSYYVWNQVEGSLPAFRQG